MPSTRDFKSPGIFAANATTVIPPTPIAGVSYRDAVSGTDDTPNGWRYGTRVESQDWNQIMFVLTSMLQTMDKQGILGWTPEVDYAVPAITFGSNGLLYLALQPSGPATASQDPVSSPLFWEQVASTGRIVINTLGASTWTVPAAMRLGFIKPVVTVIGGGGGGAVAASGAQSPNGGSGGGVAIKVVDLTGVTTVSVQVGAGGAAGPTNPSAGSAGSQSVFGAFCSATGGGGGSLGANLNPPGNGVGGDTNENIGYGSFAVYNSAANGFMGGYGGGGSSPMAASGAGPQKFGHGGGGRSATGASSCAGFQGAIIIEW